jgi:hypothetical protein
MKNRLSILMVALLGFCAMAQGLVTNVYDNGGGDFTWTNETNWTLGSLPDIDTSARMGNLSSTPATTVTIEDDVGTVNDIFWYSNTSSGEAAINVVSGGSVATVANFLLGNGTTGRRGQLYVNGGNVTAGSTLRIGQGPEAVGYAAMTSGSINVGSQFAVGYNTLGTFDMSGGTLTLTGTKIALLEQFHVNGTPVGGIMNMSGGSVLAGGAVTYVGQAPDIAQSVAADAILTMTGGSFLTKKLYINAGLSTFINAQATLLGGRMEIDSDTADGLVIKQDDTLHIEGGTFVWNGNHLAAIDALVDAGSITWTNGQAMLSGTYDASWTNGLSGLYASTSIEAGKTVVWASPLPEPKTVGLYLISRIHLLDLRRYLR